MKLKKNQKFKIKFETILITGILLLFLVCLIVSVYKIINWKLDSNETKEQEKVINEKIVVEEIKDKGDIVNPPSKSEPNPYWDYTKMSLIDVDFSELLKINPDTKGWIRVNGTNINYPFVQSKDNSYYLTHSFNKNYNDSGWVFLDYRNNINSLSKNTIIYAHGRWDNTMFGSLKNILKSNWYNNKDNYVIKLSTKKENTLWQVFSIYKIKTTNDYIRTSFNDKNDYSEFLKMLLKRSNYKFNASLNYKDKIITLSTCYNDDYKVVMHAKLIKKSSKN